MNFLYKGLICSVILSFPMVCMAEGMRASAFIEAGTVVNGMHVLTLQTPQAATIPLGPKKMFEQLLQAASVTTSAYIVTEGEKISQTIQSGDESMTRDWSVKRFRPFVIVGASNTRVFYAPVANLKNVSYLDSSLGSYRYLLKQVFGSTYIDPMAEKYYHLDTERPKKKFTSCKNDLKCFERAAKTCASATLDRKISLFGIAQSERVEIWGSAGKGRCLMYTKYLGSEPADIHDYEEMLKRGQDGLCTQDAAELARAYSNTQKGLFTSNDIKTLDCHGLEYSKP